MIKNNGGIEGVNADEQLLATVSRHPIGLIIIYLEVLVGFAAVGLILFLLAPQFLGEDNTAALSAVLILGAVFAVVILGIVTQIYNQNKLIITDQNVTQVYQRGLFSRQVSELSMANVEDVTAEQRGLLPHMFGYGELRIETAGEQNNFKFIFCPHPDTYGKIVLDARQQYTKKYSNINNN